jgi:hypothetical protein
MPNALNKDNKAAVVLLIFLQPLAMARKRTQLYGLAVADQTNPYDAAE